MKISLVLVSGLLSNECLWEHQRRHLSDIASIQMISSSQDTPKKMVQNILKMAPPKFALAGHSMGGWLCLEIMKAAPQRVQKLCLLNTTARMDSEEKKMRRQTLIQKAEEGHFDEVVQNIIDIFVFKKEVKNQVRNMFLEVGKETFILQEKSMMMRCESLSILPSIDCTTLVIYAHQDNVFSIEEHRELTKQIKNATLATVENSGHMSPMEVPDQITALLELWLRN